jgi:hypothetical protein
VTARPYRPIVTAAINPFARPALQALHARVDSAWLAYVANCEAVRQVPYGPHLWERYGRPAGPDQHPAPTNPSPTQKEANP